MTHQSWFGPKKYNFFVKNIVFFTFLWICSAWDYIVGKRFFSFFKSVKSEDIGFDNETLQTKTFEEITSDN